MDCAICGTGKGKKIRAAYRTNYAGQPVSLPSVERYRCDHCGEEFFDPKQSHLADTQVKNAVRQMQGLLPPEKIVAIREKLGLTQTQLEFLFDKGQKVVTRWESGRVVQPREADVLLRLLDRNPNMLEVLYAIAENRAKAQRKYARNAELVTA